MAVIGQVKAGRPLRWLWRLIACGGVCLGPAIAQPVEIAECVVLPSEISGLGIASRGVLARVLADRGDAVVAGQILAELEASAEQSAVELARLRFGSDVAERLARIRAETAEANAARLGSLVDRNLVKLAEQEQALLDARTARLEEEEAVIARRIAAVELQAAEAALERRRIRAPFDGVVTERMMSVGELYNEQGPVFVIAATDPLMIEAWLPASSRGLAVQGHVWQVSLETGGTAAATVGVADPVLDAATGTFRLRLSLPNPGGAILAGQNCRLSPAG